MKRLVLRNAIDRSVTLQTDAMHADEDQADRLRVYVSALGVDLGRTMIASGAARIAVFDSDFVRLATYRKAQASAKAANRGMWRSCGS